MTSPRVVLEGRKGRAYNEAAFLHFLDVERARASRGTRASRLLLVRLASQGFAAPDLNGHSRALLNSLLEAVRDTDVVGWVREGRLAGAILADKVGTSETAVAAGLDRVKATLRQVLPAGLARRVRVKVTRIRALSKGTSQR